MTPSSEASLAPFVVPATCPIESVLYNSRHTPTTLDRLRNKDSRKFARGPSCLAVWGSGVRVPQLHPPLLVGFWHHGGTTRDPGGADGFVGLAPARRRIDSVQGAPAGPL